MHDLKVAYLLNKTASHDNLLFFAKTKGITGVKNMPRKYISFIIIGLLVLFFSACEDSKPVMESQHLIRVGESVVTVDAFMRTLEMAKTAYPHNLMQNHEAYRAVQMRLLKQMTEELIIIERAKEIGITVTEKDLETKIAQIKGDYPDDEFEQALLEYAVSYKSWKKGLRTRMIMDKVIDAELKDGIKITPEDIATHYKKHYNSNDKAGADPLLAEKSSQKKNSELDREIITNIKSKKAEDAYVKWIEDLRRKHVININRTLWEEMTG